MKLVALFAVALTCAATALSGGPARAQSAESELQACVASSSGRVRIVPTGAACKTRETLRLLALAPGPSGCQVKARLTLPGVVGEGPNGTIELFTYEVAIEGPAAAGGPPTLSPLEVTKPSDSASIALFQAALLGTHFTTGRLEVLGAGGVVATTYDLTDLIVASFTLASASPCESSSPTEDLSFSFATLALVPPS
jgi:hypothetical protein